MTPDAAYLAMIAAGLHETFGWDRRRALRYLDGLPGGAP